MLRVIRSAIGWCFFVMASLAFLPAMAADGSQKTIKTIGGILRVLGEPPHGQRVTLNGKSIHYVGEDDRKHPVEQDSIEIMQTYRIQESDVVLVQGMASGNCCPFRYIYLIVIDQDGKAAALGPVVGSESEDANIKIAGEKIYIETKEYEGRRSKTNRWIYADGQLRKTR